MNQRNFFLTTKANLVREFLPKEPQPITMQHWWYIHLGVVGYAPVSAGAALR